MNRIFSFIVAASIAFLHLGLAEQAVSETIKVQLSISDATINRITPLAAGNSFFLFDAPNKKLRGVNPTTGELVDLINFGLDTLIADAPVFMSPSGKLYVFTHLLSFFENIPPSPQFIIVDLVNSPTSYSRLPLAANPILSRLESGETDQIQISAAAISSNDTILVLDTNKTLYLINADGSFGDSLDVSVMKGGQLAERVAFALAPNGKNLAIAAFKDGPKQIRYLSLLNLNNAGLSFTTKAVKLSGTYPDSIAYSSNGKYIYVGGFKGVERYNASKLNGYTLFQRKKSSSDGVYRLTAASKATMFAVYLKAANQIYSLPDRKGTGTKLSGSTTKGYAVDAIAVNSNNKRALVTALGAAGENESAHVLLLDLK